MSRIDSKKEKFQTVSLAILDILFEGGLSHLNISRVAKKSGVSRAWIYQYMGKKREDLILIAAESCSAFFARVEILDEPLDFEGLERRLREGTEFLVQSLQQNSIYIRMYFKYRGTSNFIGQTIEKYETHWLASLQKIFLQVLKIPSKEAEFLAQNILMVRLFWGFQLISQPQGKQHSYSATLQKLEALQMMLLETYKNRL